MEPSRQTVSGNFSVETKPNQTKLNQTKPNQTNHISVKEKVNMEWSEEEISTRVRESGKEIEGNEGQRRALAEQEFKASAQQILCTC